MSPPVCYLKGASYWMGKRLVIFKTKFTLKICWYLVCTEAKFPVVDSAIEQVYMTPSPPLLPPQQPNSSYLHHLNIKLATDHRRTYETW